MTDDRWYIYIIQKRKSYYTGITTDVSHRTSQHGVGKPLYLEGPMDKFHAAAREREIKGWSREKKEKLLRAVSLS